MTVEIRHANELELTAIADIADREIYEEANTAIGMMNWMKGKFPWVQHFVAEDDGYIVGFASWRLHDSYGSKQIWELSWLAVVADFQNKGIGRKLLQESLEMVKECGGSITAVFTTTDEKNDTAQAFYEKVLKPDQKVVLENIWGKDGSIVLYIKRL